MARETFGGAWQESTFSSPTPASAQRAHSPGSLTEADWDRSSRVDLKGVWLTTKYVVPHMIERRYGKILITASRRGPKAEERRAHYVAAGTASSGT